VALRVIVGLMLLGAAWSLSTILVPFVAALVLAIALSPAADWLERRGLPRAASSLVCTLALAVFLAVAAGLVTYQAGTLLREADRYVGRFGTMLDHATRRLDLPARHGSGAAGRGERLAWRALDSLGAWAVSGVGGAIGVIGGAVVAIAYLFYMLHGRGGWVESITSAARRLGLRPSHAQLEKVRGEMVRFVAVLALEATAYAVLVSLALWGIGVPHPVLWGVLAGVCQMLPYFGPLVASVLPIIVSLSLGSWWQPLATAGVFLGLHGVDAYAISPLLYGKAVRFDPVTILFGALFFGALWGPVGLAVATPMMIVLRGLLLISPDTPALDALADVKDEKANGPVREPLAVGTPHNGGSERLTLPPSRNPI
jgi:predicted PurR-regulated permease PerM